MQYSLEIIEETSTALVLPLKQVCVSFGTARHEDSEMRNNSARKAQIKLTWLNLPVHHHFNALVHAHVRVTEKSLGVFWELTIVLDLM